MTAGLKENPVREGYEAYAIVRKRDLKSLNKTTIRFKISLKGASKKAAPKWKQILKGEQKKAFPNTDNQTDGKPESDLEKITKSKVGLRGISVFEALDDAAAQIRAEIEDIQSWMMPDNGEYVCSLDLAPLVWTKMIYVRDELAPELRNKLKQQYNEGLSEFEYKIDEFLSAQTWDITEEQREEAKVQLLKRFPDIAELEDCLQVVIARPVIVPALNEQMNEEQAECLNQITQFIEGYDKDLQENLTRSAIAGGQQLATKLLEDLAEWEPGKKPVQFRRRIEKHLDKVKMLMSFAGDETAPTLSQMMGHLDAILNTTPKDGKKLSQNASSELEEQMSDIYRKLLGEQQKLIEIGEEEGVNRSNWVVFEQPEEESQDPGEN
jgi:hypothetical protein